MKCIVAGGRDFNDQQLFDAGIAEFLLHYNAITSVISGGCASGTLTHVTKDGRKVYGADGMGEAWAEKNNIPVITFLPEYDKYPPNVAPVMRNESMAQAANALLLYFDGKSKGSADMLKRAKRHGLYIHIVNY